MSLLLRRRVYCCCHDRKYHDLIHPIKRSFGLPLPFERLSFFSSSSSSSNNAVKAVDSSTSVSTLSPSSSLVDDYMKQHGSSQAATKSSSRQKQKQKLMSIFPWRHSSKLISRLDYNLKNDNGSDDNMEYNLIGYPFPGISVMKYDTDREKEKKSHVNFCTLMKYMTLVSTMKEWLYPYSGYFWFEERKHVFAGAFCRAVEEMIHGNYTRSQIVVMPKKDREKENDDDGDDYFNSSINIQFQHDTKSEMSAADDEEVQESNIDINSILDSNLLDLYASTRNTSSSSSETTSSKEDFPYPKYSIQLETKPYDAELISLYPIPILTRENTRQNPELKLEARRILQEYFLTGGINQFMVNCMSLAEKTARLNNEESSSLLVQTTVTAQVLLKCKESFLVKDLETDEIIQGDGLVRDVYHLVRFEQIYRNDLAQGYGLVDQGNWKIVDWDDLLDGNIFY